MPHSLLQVLGAPLKAALSMLSAAFADTLSDKVCGGPLLSTDCSCLHRHPTCTTLYVCVSCPDAFHPLLVFDPPGGDIGSYTGDGFHGDRCQYTGKRYPAV